MGNNPLISVVILTWNRKEEVLKAIHSVLNQKYKNIEIVVVDNHSTDGTFEALNALVREHPNIKLIRTYKNLGCPIGRNIAMANASGDIIFSLDDDAEIDNNCLEEVIKTFNDFPNAAVVACKIEEENSSRKNYETVRKVGVFNGGGFAIKRDVLKEVGFFPDYFRQAEETYLALKILDKGYDIIYNPNCKIYHKPSPKGRVRYDIIYYGFRHDIENVFRLLPIKYALPIAIYKLVPHFKNYIRNGFMLSFFKDVFGVILNGISKSKLENEKIKFETFLLYRKLNGR